MAGNEKMDLTKASSDQTKAAMALANSNMANNSDGSFHIYLEPKKKPKPIPKPVDSIIQYYHEWLDNDGYPFWSFWENVRSWWEVRHLPNVMLVHFSNLKKDMPKEIFRIAGFLDIDINEENWHEILQHCSFDYMKANATPSVPLGAAFWDGGAEQFIYKGVNGRWRELLNSTEIKKYDSLAVKELGEECAAWLTTGEIS